MFVLQFLDEINSGHVSAELDSDESSVVSVLCTKDSENYVNGVNECK